MKIRCQEFTVENSVALTAELMRSTIGEDVFIEVNP